VRHIVNLDFTAEIFEKEFIEVARATNGSYPREDLLNMRYDRYVQFFNDLRSKIERENAEADKAARGK